ncbi:hypothetical protein D3C73_963070 [compost metagenome]
MVSKIGCHGLFDPLPERLDLPHVAPCGRIGQPIGLAVAGGQVEGLDQTTRRKIVTKEKGTEHRHAMAGYRCPGFNILCAERIKACRPDRSWADLGTFEPVQPGAVDFGNPG